MKSRALLIVTGFAIIVGACLYFFYRPAPTAAAASGPQIPVVAVAKAQLQTIERAVEITAELQPFLQTNVYAKIPGYLRVINVDVGDRVKAGEVIAQLETPEEQADVARAQTTFNEEKLDYNRIESIIHQRPGLLAQDEVDKAQTAYDVAKANLDHAKVMAGYATITAPFDGVVTKRTADPGALIQAGTSSAQAAPLVHISQDSKLRLILPVPEEIVPQIHVGTPVTVTIPALKKTMTAPVSRYSDQVNDATRTMEVEVDLENSDLAMTPGMYARASIMLARHDNALAIPVQALGGKDTPNVWLIGAQDRIEERAVKVGIQTPDKVEILDGLQAGDEVVFGARSEVSPGMQVQPQVVKGAL